MKMRQLAERACKAPRKNETKQVNSLNRTSLDLSSFRVQTELVPPADRIKPHRLASSSTASQPNMPRTNSCLPDLSRDGLSKLACRNGYVALQVTAQQRLRLAE